MANEQVYYSALHWAKKAEKDANRAAVSSANAEDAKNLANEAVSRLGEFDSTVENVKAEITTLSSTEQATIVAVAEENKNSAVSEINSTKSDAVKTVEQAGAAIANYQQPVEVITETSGTITLQSTKIYQMQITDAVSFVLPSEISVDYFNQIKVMAQITGAPTIDWGTVQFFNKAIPEIEEGNYDIYFDYDNLLNAWICGAIVKGVAE